MSDDLVLGFGVRVSPPQQRLDASSGFRVSSIHNQHPHPYTITPTLSYSCLNLNDVVGDARFVFAGKSAHCPGIFKSSTLNPEPEIGSRVRTLNRKS